MHTLSALVFIATYRNRKEQRYAGMKRVDQSTCCGCAKTQGCCKGDWRWSSLTLSHSRASLLLSMSEICQKLESGVIPILNVLGKWDTQNH